MYRRQHFTVINNDGATVVSHQENRFYWAVKDKEQFMRNDFREDQNVT